MFLEQTCMILISHAFHYPGVQCYFIQDRKTWTKKDREKQEELDIKEQEKLDKRQIPMIMENENDKFKLIIWGVQYQTMKKSSYQKVSIHC